MDAVLNPEKGEIGIRLGGRLYPMQGSMTACNAIESQIGSVVWLWLRFTSKEYFPTFREMAVVVTECIKAAGRDREDQMMSKYSVEKIEELLYAEGVLVTDPFAEILGAMCTGGATKKKDPSQLAAPSEQTDSPTGS